MGIQDRKDREKEEMRRLILDAAMKLFKENGFEDVSIRKIADQIEYSPTTIYLHFENKDQILLALHEEGFQLLDQLFQSALTIEDPIDRVHRFGELYMEFGLKNPEYYDLMFLKTGPMDALSHDGEEDWKVGDHAFSYLLQASTEILERNPHMGIDAMTAAISLWSMCHGFVCLQLRNRVCWYNIESMNSEQAGFLGLSWLSSLMKKK